MKKLLLALFAFLAATAFAQTITGQRVISQKMVTWSASSGNWSNKTRLLFLGGNVYVDTSSTGQAGQFKRVDNTADSCSNPVPLASDTNGSGRAVWEYRLWLTVRAVDKDSSTQVYRVQTRERVYDGTTKTTRWTPYTLPGKNGSYSDLTVQDSIVIPNVSVTSKTAQYAYAHFAGSWGRLCPDDPAGMANAATDSIFADSLIIFTR